MGTPGRSGPREYAYVRIGLSGLFAPSDHQMEQILALFEDSANGPVFVHCRRGADRTGLVIACYRIDHDHGSNAQAKARKQGKRFGRPSAIDNGQRRKIAERYAAGATMAELAAEYEVGEATIFRALKAA